MEQDQLAAARGQYEMALGLRRDIGEKETVLQTRVALARLGIEEGQSKDANQRLANAETCFISSNSSTTNSGRVSCLSAHCSISRRMPTQSGRSSHCVLSKRRRKTASCKLRFSIEFARVLLAEHDLPASRILLDKVSQQAETSGFVGLRGKHKWFGPGRREKPTTLAGATKQLNALGARARTAGLLLLARRPEPILNPGLTSASEPGSPN